MSWSLMGVKGLNFNIKAERLHVFIQKSEFPE